MAVITSSSESEITLRRAVLADKDAVMSLGDMYSGRDYLFALYSELVDHPNTYPIVAVVNSEVVGFYMTTSFDGGVTVMKRAARVAENYRGRGLLQLMEEELERHTAHHRPQALYETLANTNFVDHLAERFLSKGYKTIYRKGVINKLLRLSNSSPSEKATHPGPPTLLNGDGTAPPTFKNVKEDAPPITHHPTTLDVHEMSPEDLSVLFKAETSVARVFPQKRLFNFYLGYRLQDENIPTLLGKRGGAFYTMDTSDTHARTPKDENENIDLTLNGTAPNSKKQEGEFLETNNKGTELTPSGARRVVMVTFYYCFPTRTGFLYFLDIYTTPELLPVESDGHLSEHLQRHLATARRHFPNKDGVLTLTFDAPLSREMVTSVLDKLGIKDVLAGQENFQILYEREARRDKHKQSHQNDVQS